VTLKALLRNEKCGGENSKCFFDSQIEAAIKNAATIIVRGTLFFSKKSFI
jgi:hypothetical protein